jgi:flagellar biosynthetic protein FliR
VNAVAPETILAAFAIFCRVGSCLMIAPGFASSQIPVRVRLYVALGVSLSLTPMLIAAVRPAIGDGSGITLLGLIFSESAAGLLIGLVARLFFMALHFVTVAMTQSIGLSGIPGASFEDGEQEPALATLFMVAATTLLFVTGLHAELIRGLVDSYTALPPGPLDSRLALVDIADQTTRAFVVALRIGSPFIVYSAVVNFAVGVANKLTPQIPVYFIATPFIMLGGLFLLLLVVPDFLGTFIAAFESWLRE